MSRSNAPRTSQAQGSEYQPLSPPIDSTTSQTASGEAGTTALRSSVNSEPPAQSGSVGIGSLGAPGMYASDHRVATSASLTRLRARRTDSSKPSSPSGGSGT